ncbi:hypothetical protein G8O24_00035 [Bradyrhizobium sp. INPA01-394B]|uniref:Uncharacterized protein n=1 Tax=Bradyrhizobium campsiandrae TaxID=1729892 RepID=A0ABR7UE46_9BRAD|nr:hypothetical protein [Bradyrhizobium campsiandrae]MBC9875730.1 hypothetical protein [Bradyrhizobium campsiandrae]MBC9981707.1 hypothetical protein [Bradyrhizobium campsiandrae]
MLRCARNDAVGFAVLQFYFFDNAQSRRCVGDRDAFCIDQFGLHGHVALGPLDHPRSRLGGTKLGGTDVIGNNL